MGGPQQRPRCCCWALALALAAACSCALLWGTSARRANNDTGALPPLAEPDLAGELPAAADFGLYLGGFCFGHNSKASRAMVGRVQVRVHWPDGVQPDSNKGMRLFMMFDDEPEHWPRTQPRWNVSTCHEKMARSSITMQMVSPRQSYHVSIHEHTIPRHWHMAIVGCGLENESSSPISYEIKATSALSQWGADTMTPAGCPPDLWADIKQKFMDIAIA